MITSLVGDVVGVCQDIVLGKVLLWRLGREDIEVVLDDCIFVADKGHHRIQVMS